MEDIYINYKKFVKLYEGKIKYLDGLNGDCGIYAYCLYNFFKDYYFNLKIFSLNKGIHYWIEINNYPIDCKGIHKNRIDCLRIFDKYIVKQRIQEISINDLKKIVDEKVKIKNKKVPFCL